MRLYWGEGFARKSTRSRKELVSEVIRGESKVIHPVSHSPWQGPRVSDKLYPLGFVDIVREEPRSIVGLATARSHRDFSVTF